MAPIREDPPRVQRRGPSDVVPLGGEHSEDKPDTTRGQLPALIAKFQISADEELRVALDEVRGHPVVDIRIFAAFTLAKVPMPTKRAVSVPVRRIPDLIEALRDAERRAQRLGSTREGE